MRGKNSERVILQKMLRYCDEIEQILKKHHSDREEFENDTEFQFACGMCIIQIGELVAGLDEGFVKKHSDIPWRQTIEFTLRENSIVMNQRNAQCLCA
ncbi:MAG: hypothetical protein NC541_08140 [bacterium]|nr:hypothetical protein [bacterium]